MFKSDRGQLSGVVYSISKAFNSFSGQGFVVLEALSWYISLDLTVILVLFFDLFGFVVVLFYLFVFELRRSDVLLALWTPNFDIFLILSELWFYRFIWILVPLKFFMDAC